MKEKISYKSLHDLDNFSYEIKNNDINFENLQFDNNISNSSDDEEEINNNIDCNIDKSNSEDGGDGVNNDNGSGNSDLYNQILIGNDLKLNLRKIIMKIIKRINLKIIIKIIFI